MKKKMLVFGHGSLVGSRFIELLHDMFDLYGASRDSYPELDTFLVASYHVDITDEHAVESIFSKEQFDYVINFSALTNVDEIEKTRPTDIQNLDVLNDNPAYQVNTLGVAYILAAANKYNVFPLFASTETVFDGENGPYSEDDPIAQDYSDVSWYACTKILAEQLITSSPHPWLILRFSYPYRKSYNRKLDFARNFMKLYQDFRSGVRKEIYPIFADQYISLTYIDDIAEVVRIALEMEITGILHISSPTITTPYDFFCGLLRTLYNVEQPELIVPKGSIVAFQQQRPDIPKRPIKGGIISNRLNELGFLPTDWKDGIKLLL